ncbi:hypothetical protein SIID45300_03040 [Candidatus Magnetaquicoccaceae bacterium FCR-1]|uniref:Uncharacterized protein n=1 Tax=Candidatus Magnetaquiglobus chichijimensis TaxID=3141448 RepID=A0ABQ0CCS3_9PROT
MRNHSTDIEIQHRGQWVSSQARDAAIRTICERVAEGASLKAVCLADPQLPSPGLVYVWCDHYPKYSSQMRAAHLAKGDVLADRILEVAEDESLEPAARSVRIGAYRWLAGKLNPDRWGEVRRVDITSSVSSLTDDELTIRIEQLQKLVYKPPSGEE